MLKALQTAIANIAKSNKGTPKKPNTNTTPKVKPQIPPIANQNKGSQNATNNVKWAVYVPGIPKTNRTWFQSEFMGYDVPTGYWTVLEYAENEGNNHEENKDNEENKQDVEMNQNNSDEINQDESKTNNPKTNQTNNKQKQEYRKYSNVPFKSIRSKIIPLEHLESLYQALGDSVKIRSNEEPFVYEVADQKYRMRWWNQNYFNTTTFVLSRAVETKPSAEEPGSQKKDTKDALADSGDNEKDTMESKEEPGNTKEIIENENASDGNIWDDATELFYMRLPNYSRDQVVWKWYDNDNAEYATYKDQTVINELELCYQANLENNFPKVLFQSRFDNCFLPQLTKSLNEIKKDDFRRGYSFVATMSDNSGPFNVIMNLEQKCWNFSKRSQFPRNIKRLVNDIDSLKLQVRY